METALYGGSFNPLHIGHLAILRKLADSFERIYLVVSPKNPLKDNIDASSAEMRLKAASEALLRHPELIESALQMAHEAGLTTILDLASYNTVEEHLEFMQRLIRRYVDVVFANEEEATAFTGKEDDEALNEIGELADIVVLKQGRRGSLVKVGHESVRCGVIDCKAIDTTGAGDLYAAGFLWGLIGGLSPIKCATAGAILSGNVIEVVGSRMGANRWTSIRQELKKL